MTEPTATRDSLPRPTFAIGAALREAIREGITAERIRADVMAGLVVGIVALPLSMALAIASGVPPQHGLYTAIVAGGIIALTGGSRVQVSGPTAAFVVILVPVSAKFGLGGLCVATVLAGVMLMLMGAFGVGQLLRFVPFPVTTGFTSGIAVVIATLQLKDFFGLTVQTMPEHYIERVAALARAAPTARWQDFVIAALTLTVLLAWPRLLPRVAQRVPGPLVALALAGVAATALAQLVDGYSVATIGSRFSYVLDGGGVGHGIPRLPPLFALPWHLPGADGAPIGISFEMVRTLLPSAFAIAMLGAIESLLSATVADGMANTRHDPNAELVGQGLGNIVAPFFGGFAATGAIARTATAVRSGARTPIASVTHALFVLLAVLLLAPLLSHLPMAALAALLVIVAWNMSEVKHFVHTLKTAPRSDIVVLLTCFGLTVVFDMVVSVTVGVMLAALLFMKRMAELTGARVIEGDHPGLGERAPPGVVIYEIAGPLFFGAAQKAMSELQDIHAQVRAVVLEMSSVPVMDATGTVALESALQRLAKRRVLVVLSGVQPQPRTVLERAHIVESPGVLAFAPDLKAAVQRAGSSAAH